MLRDRTKFHRRLIELLGSNYVYYQPPATVKMTYPCIIYDMSDIVNQYANNKKYIGLNRYTVTYVSKDPDSVEIIKKLEDMQFSSFDRHYVADNLHHFVYTIYY